MAVESLATAAALESLATVATVVPQECMATGAIAAQQESKATGATPRLDRRKRWLVRGAPCSVSGSSRNAARAAVGMMLLHVVRVFVRPVSRRRRRLLEG